MNTISRGPSYAVIRGLKIDEYNLRCYRDAFKQESRNRVDVGLYELT